MLQVCDITGLYIITSIESRLGMLNSSFQPLHPQPSAPPSPRGRRRLACTAAARLRGEAAARARGAGQAEPAGHGRGLAAAGWPRKGPGARLRTRAGSQELRTAGAAPGPRGQPVRGRHSGDSPRGSAGHPRLAGPGSAAGGGAARGKRRDGESPRRGREGRGGRPRGRHGVM